MMRHLIAAVAFVLLLTACGGSYVPGHGTDFGAGQCVFGVDIATKNASGVMCQPEPMPAEGFCAKPLCFGRTGGPLPRVGYSGGNDAGDEMPCRTTDGLDVLGTDMMSSTLQKTRLLEDGQFFSSCKAPQRCTGGPESCDFMQVSPVKCAPIAWLDSYVSVPTVFPRANRELFKWPFGGNFHDGDESFNVAPFAMGVQGINGDAAARKSLDLRPQEQLQNAGIFTGVHVEVPWCRWYGAPVHIESQYEGDRPSFYCSFRPDQGERLSVAGDWIVEGSHVEVHDARFFAAVRPHRSDDKKDDFQGCMVRGIQAQKLIEASAAETPCADPADVACKDPNRWHVMASGFFADETAQKDELYIRVPIPPSTAPALTKLEYDVPTLTGAVGCYDGSIDVSIVCKPDAKDSVPFGSPGYCDMRIKRQGGLVADRNCGTEDVCPCTSRADTLLGKCSDTDRWDDLDMCRMKGNSPIAFARDVRVDWRDPLDAFECNCDCADPSAPGATIRARVQGCVTPGFADDEPRPLQRACDEVCAKSPTICGDSQDCRIGVCRAAPPGQHEGRLLARNACEEESPPLRVAPHGDYRADLDRNNSYIEVGSLSQKGAFSAAVRSKLRGGAFFNITTNRMEFADLELAADDFVVPGIFLGIGATDVKTFRTTLLARAHADVQEDGSYAITAGRLKTAVAAVLNGQPNTAMLLNRATVTVRLDLGARTMELDGIAGDGTGKGARIHVVATITNVPPIALEPAKVSFECSSPLGTPVVVSASTSSDPDPGDSLAHHQWFAPSGAGAGNSSTLAVTLPLGTHSYGLHVYDEKLGSDSVPVPIGVVDTTAPTLSAGIFPSCAWSPNHKIIVLALGQGVSADAADACDAAPVVEIVGVESSEPADIGGSGSTAEDVRFGKNHVCIRIERSGTGTGRAYGVLLRATDASGNFTEKAVSVLVPHDVGGGQQCTRIKGSDDWAAECTN